MSKTLIAYGTRKGITAHAAEIISLSLKDKHGLEVDVVNLKKTKKVDLSQYENVILGSSIAMGKWTRQAKRFLKRDFTGKKLFIYITSGLAGEGIQNNEPEKYDQAVKQYIEDVLVNYPKLKPVAVKAIGGRFVIFGTPVFDTWDPAFVEKWAEEIGEKIKI